jgi:hypothetical protein
MEDLQRVTGFSRDQLRDRLGYLGHVLGHDTQRGPRNAIIVGDATLAALDRMKTLESGGLGAKAAADQVGQELDNPENKPPQVNPQHAQTNVEAPSAEVIAAMANHIDSLEVRIKELGDDKTRLIDELSEARGQVAAMLPSESEGRQKLTWGQWFKVLISGEL